MDWLFLGLAGILETVWTIAMKQSLGFTRPVPSAIVFVAGGLSLYLLSLSMRSIPLGVAYSLWTGIGATGALFVGALLLGETLDSLRWAAIFLILTGLVVMRVSVD